MFGKRHDGGENGGGISADGDGNGHIQPARLPQPVVMCPATMSQPAHDHPVRPKRLHAVDADIDIVGIIRRTGDDQRPGDERGRFARPAPLHRQVGKVDCISRQHPFLHRRAGDVAWPHGKCCPEQRQLAPGLCHGFRRPRLAQFCQLRAKRGQAARFQPEPPFDALTRAEQIGKQRHLPHLALVVDGLLEQQRRPALGEHAAVDFGDLVHQRDRLADSPQLPTLFQQPDETAQIGSAGGFLFCLCVCRFVSHAACLPVAAGHVLALPQMRVQCERR
ncbi:hypothetical protein D3C72_953220 [compost metagenome]